MCGGAGGDGICGSVSECVCVVGQAVMVSVCESVCVCVCVVGQALMVSVWYVCVNCLQTSRVVSAMLAAAWERARGGPENSLAGATRKLISIVPLQVSSGGGGAGDSGGMCVCVCVCVCVHPQSSHWHGMSLCWVAVCPQTPPSQPLPPYTHTHTHTHTHTDTHMHK